MKRRLGISAVVGAATFVAVYVVFTFAFVRPNAVSHPQNRSMASQARLAYGELFGLIGAAVIFGAGTVLERTADRD